MSYRLDHKCHQCELEPKCLDLVLVQGAINAIHSMNYSQRAGFLERAHFGGGTIKIECQNFKPVEQGEVPKL
jgi:hypothetical protein